jgi:hypothetical protein
MWCRIAARYSVWYEPHPLAAYRSHFSSESSRLQRDGKDIRDTLRCIDRNVKLLRPQTSCRVRNIACINLAFLALENAQSMAIRGEYLAAWSQTKNALLCSFSPKIILKSLRLGWQCMVVILRRAIIRRDGG